MTSPSEYGPIAKQFRVLMHKRFGIGSPEEAARFISAQYGWEIESLERVFSDEKGCAGLMQSIQWASAAGLTDDEIKQGILPPLSTHNLKSIHKLIEEKNENPE